MRIKLIRTQTQVREFSKRVIVAMTWLWFAGAVFGGAVCWLQGYGLDALLNYIGYPMSAGIVGYMAKAALENREKVKKSPASDMSGQGEDHP